MVTRNRARLAARALRCLANQTYQDRELLILDDGDEDYEPFLAPYRDQVDILYHRIKPDPTVKLGGLRSKALDLATGDLIAQWDDDEWYHPQRLAMQVAAMDAQGLGACVLQYTLMHLDQPDYIEHPYRATLANGTPGTIVHRKTDVRYPNWSRSEDTEFRARLAEVMKIGMVAEPHSHLFIRCFHGQNTWDEKHFRRRLRNSTRDLLRYAHARFVRGDVRQHPAFRMTNLEQQSFQSFLADSRELGVLKH